MALNMSLVDFDDSLKLAFEEAFLTPESLGCGTKGDGWGNSNLRPTSQNTSGLVKAVLFHICKLSE